MQNLLETGRSEWIYNDAGCFFDRSLEETVLNIEISFEEMVYCV